MISAVILVNTDMGAQDQVLKSIRLVEGVEEAHALYGVYDLIVKIKASSIDKLKNITKLGVRRVAGVTSSLTLLLVDEPIKSMRRGKDSASASQDNKYFEPIIEVQHSTELIQEF